jgi:hypothetical protein
MFTRIWARLNSPHTHTHTKFLEDITITFGLQNSSFLLGVSTKIFVSIVTPLSVLHLETVTIYLFYSSMYVAGSFDNGNDVSLSVKELNFISNWVTFCFSRISFMAVIAGHILPVVLLPHSWSNLPQHLPSYCYHIFYNADGSVFWGSPSTLYARHNADPTTRYSAV